MRKRKTVLEMLIDNDGMKLKENVKVEMEMGGEMYCLYIDGEHAVSAFHPACIYSLLQRKGHLVKKKD